MDMRRRAGNMDKASELLATVAAETKDSDLAGLAEMMRLDSIEKVKETLDKLTKSLRSAQVEEVAQKDTCVQRLHSNSMDTERYTRDEFEAESEARGLISNIQELTTIVKTVTGEVEELQKASKVAAEDREASKKDFETTVAEQVQTQRLFKTAIDVLTTPPRKWRRCRK
ncbi:unnamed protein product [Polarella glacialis]|uniref:Uncharacterized protein n=1 Tax=Polarella glacialis TaxID=89957 RepID=A0A813GLC9_POLGL|nr:unnamed protein product [Polarella glacialis]